MPSFLFPVVWRQSGLSRRLHMAAGLGLLAQGGYMCRLRSVAGTGSIHVRSFQLQNPLSTILWMEFTAEPFDGLWSRCLQSIIWRAMQLKRKEFNYVSNRALVWLAFETCEVVSAKRHSTDGQIEPNRQAGRKPLIFLSHLTLPV